MITNVIVTVRFRNKINTKVVTCFDNKVPMSFLYEMAREIGCGFHETFSWW